MTLEESKLTAELAAANEEIARLKEQANRIADERDQNLGDKIAEKTAHAATTAKLGRAVEVLQNARSLDADTAKPRAAILADADSKAAGEAWAGFVSLLSKYPAPWIMSESGHCLRSANGHYIASYDPHGDGPWVAGEAIRDTINALAAVDARRGVK